MLRAGTLLLAFAAAINAGEQPRAAATFQDTHELLRQVNTRFLSNKILLLADAGTGQKQLARWWPFVAEAHRMKDRATAYVSKSYVCKLLTADPDVLAGLLDDKH